MQIDGCYFPKLDEIMGSDRSQDDNDTTFRTFLDDAKTKKAKEK